MDSLNSTDRASFQSWYKSGNTDDLPLWRERIFHSDAIHKATKRMFSTLNRAALTANYLSVEIAEITSPIHGLILQACTATSNNLEV